MPEVSREELSRFIGFDEQDAANLRVLAARVPDFLPELVDQFYTRLQAHPAGRQVLSGGPEQIDRLRRSLGAWATELFGGTYGDAYWEQRARIGRVHVEIGMPQELMPVAMEIIWQECERGIRGLGLPDAAVKLSSLHKLLTLELVQMLDSYRQAYTEEVRQLEREAVKERLTQAEHLAQIGQLAASLAHEIKNPLAGISGAIQVIRDGMDPQNPHRPVLGEVLRQINRLDGTVKDLLVYARPKPPRFSKVDLNRLIAQALTTLREEPEMLRVRFEYVKSRQLPTVAADANQLEQLLTNLLLNAAQATRDEGLVRLTAMANAEVVKLIVEDRGSGMDEQAARRALEPFYTTKAKGTGLGLPICQKIAEAHGGGISIESRVGEGTQVLVELPLEPPGAERD